LIKFHINTLTNNAHLIVKSIGLTLIYFIAAHYSLLLSFEGSNASPIWPPSGIAVAIIYALGYRYAPTITLGAFIANFLSFSTGSLGVGIESILISIVIAMGNTLEAVLAVWLIRYLVEAKSPFLNPQHVFKFLLAVILSCSLAASIGSASLYLGGVIPSNITSEVWLNWWLGDIGGMMVIAPLVLSWLLSANHEISKRTLLEVVATLLLVGVVSLIVFSSTLTSNHIDRLLVYLSILTIAWIAYRFKQRDVTLAIFVFSACAVGAAINDLGPFNSADLNNSLILLVSFIVMLSLTGLLLSADIIHRRQTLVTNKKAPVIEWLTLLSLLGITIIAWHLISLDSERIASRKFDVMVKETQSHIRERMNIYQEVLQGGVGLFAASNHVTNEEWRAYYEELHLQEKLPGILGFGYAEMLKQSDKEAFLESMRTDVNPNYVIKPSGNRDYYAAIKYLEPEDKRNKEAVGYDMYSEAVRRTALRDAALSGHMSISGKITLVQEIDHDVQAGILMYLPLYKKGLDTNTPDERWKAIQGYVYAPFRMHDLMNGILRQSLTDLRLQLFDGESNHPADLMYDSNAKKRDIPRISKNALSKYVLISIEGHVWTLYFETLPSFEASIDLQKAQLVLILGLLLSLLLFMLVRSLSVNREAALSLAKEMTSALRESENRVRKLYESTPVMLQSIDPEGRLISVSDYWLEKHGYTREEVIGRMSTDFMTHETAVYARDVIIPQSMRDGYCKNIPYQKVTKSGEVFDVLISSIVDYDAESKPLFGMAVLIDVTEENAAKRATDELLDTIRSQFIMSITDVRGKIIEVNDAFCEISQYSSNELIGVNHRLIKSDFHDKSFYSDMWRTISLGMSWRGEICNRAKDGTLYWVDSVISPLKGVDGKIERYIAIRSDITQRKFSEQAEREQKQQIQQIIENQSVATFMIDAQHRVLHWNQACEILTGVEADSIVGKAEAWRGFYPEARPCLADLVLDDHKDWAGNYYPIQGESALMKKGWHAENWFENLGGKRRYVIFDAAPIYNMNGEVVAVIETLQDITQSKLAEVTLFEERKYLASVIEGTNAGTWQWNVNTNECRFNKQWSQILGYQLEELGDDLFGIWRKLTHDEDYPEIMLQLNQHFSGEKTMYECEFRMHHKDGYWLWVLARGRVMSWTDEGQPEWMYGTHVDITDRKRIDLELRQAYSNLEEFTSVASHDLKSPLRGIADLMDWINEDLGTDITENVKNNLNRVQIRVKRMETLIDELLQYSRAGAVNHDLIQVDPVMMVRDIVELQNIPTTFKVIVTGQEPPFKTSVTPLKTIIRNFIANAVKHHDRLDGHIEINIRSEIAYIIFEVKDDGPGIPESAHEAVFKLFNSLSKTNQSTGIGLAVSRRMAETHGAHIELESSEEKRITIFRIYWPRFISV
jgi:PAS domain S-box-containing protein